MEIISKYFLFLAAYWAAFFWKFLKDPYLLCTSELASTYFPHWRWMGKEFRRGRFPFFDNIYYRYPGCIPFLSTFYPPKLLTAWLGAYLPIDTAFRFFSLFILIHYLAASVIAFLLFCEWASPLVSLFGAITLTYAAYNIKPTTPASAFTVCWLPGIFIKGWFGALCCGMSILGGYYPIMVYVLPIALVMNPCAMVGFVIGLPQLIPFLRYWRKSVRSGEKVNPKFGRVPAWKLLDLIIPTKDVTQTNGAHYPEVEMYMGIAILFIRPSFWLLPLCLSLLILCGILPPIQRIPARALYLLALSITMLTLPGLPQSHLLLSSLVALQAFLLFRNSSIYPSFPFVQWWDRPSKLYASYQGLDSWPHFSGYLTERKTKGYSGAFSLKEGAWSTQPNSLI